MAAKIIKIDVWARVAEDIRVMVTSRMVDEDLRSRLLAKDISRISGGALQLGMAPGHIGTDADLVCAAPGDKDDGLACLRIFVSNHIYPYNTLKSFWIDQSKDRHQLLIMSGRMIMPLLSIPLGDASEEKIRAIMSRSVKEEELKEPVSHTVMEHFGF